MEVTFAEEYSAIHKGLLHCLGVRHEVICRQLVKIQSG